MATDDQITKRIIISGLTPAITVEDITRRLGSFGTVKAADGFGLSDGLGQPRNYGYVTLETTVSKFGRCMNLLSGSTWKGAKLRFGAAKPDYRERIAMENRKAVEEPPKKKRKVFGAAHSEDMTLVTPENASQRPGWKVSDLGRVTRPIKMRPTRPLPEMQEEASRHKSISQAAKPGVKKKRPKLKDPDTRARRKVLDMPKWGSTHLKGIFLDLEVGMNQAEHERNQDQDIDFEDQDTPSDSAGESEAETDQKRADSMILDTDAVGVSVSKLVIDDASSPLSPRPLQSTGNVKNSQPQNIGSADIQLEKAQTLTLLSTIFGGKDQHGSDDDWVGRESVGSDIDIDDPINRDIVLDEDGDDIEVVPRRKGSEGVALFNEPTLSEGDTPETQMTELVQARPVEAPSAQKKLKDLFAPREEEAGFSLLGHLDLDVEFDEDINFAIDQNAQGPPVMDSPIPSSVIPAAVSNLSVPGQSSRPPIVLDPKTPLFFPLNRSEKADSRKPRQKDICDVFEECGWGWRDPAVKFWKTETDEEIRKHWEETRGDLTRDWKRRWREAGKVRKRKKGGEGDD